MPPSRSRRSDPIRAPRCHHRLTPCNLSPDGYHGPVSSHAVAAGLGVGRGVGSTGRPGAGSGSRSAYPVPRSPALRRRGVSATAWRSSLLVRGSLSSEPEDPTLQSAAAGR